MCSFDASGRESDSIVISFQRLYYFKINYAEFFKLLQRCFVFFAENFPYRYRELLGHVDDAR
jgi:hypothetical protein